MLAIIRCRIFFQFAIQKFKDQDIRNYNFVCFVWVWNVIAHIEGGTQDEGVWGEYLGLGGAR